MFQCQMSNNCGGRVILFQNIQKNVGIRLGHQRVLHFMVTQPRDAVPVGVLLVEGKFSQLPDAMEGVKLGENNVVPSVERLPSARLGFLCHWPRQPPVEAPSQPHPCRAGTH